MIEYREIFKCRLCGETYESGCTRNENIALQATIAACIHSAKPPVPQCPSITEIHSCKDGSIGVSDFQGFRKVDSEE